MVNRILKTNLLLFLILAFFFANFFSFGEKIFSQAERFQVLAMTPSEERESLEEELRKLEEQIAQYDEDITKTAQEKKTLQNQIYLLKKEVDKLDLQIYQGNVMIKDLGYQIIDTEGSISQTSLNIQESRSKLVSILQLTYEEDQKSILEILLSEVNISDFFTNLVALETLNAKNQELLENIKDLKVTLESQKQALGGEKLNLESVVEIQALQKQQSESAKSQKNYFLKLTEAEYQASLKEKEVVEREAALIRARIFDLIGVPEAPTFGEALEIAKHVEGLTGVRPAFLLAVLTQESNIGKNVGQCYLKDAETADGIVISSGRTVKKVMKPMGLSGRKGDVDDFLIITRELGRDPFNTPVSCPMSYGYGGAMGPAQFIPSTWMIYRDELKAITGRAGDPWNIRDAFLASALYLADYGAAKQNYNDEWRAAMIYFSGTSKRTSYNGYGFYGDAVIKITKGYVADIKALGSGS